MKITINSIETLAKSVSKYTESCGVLQTKPHLLNGINYSELKLTPLSKDIINVSKIKNYSSTESEIYYNYLHHFIPKSGYKQIENKQHNILMLGCGSASEAPGLNSFFGNKQYGQLSDNIKIYGLDLEPREIRYAKENLWYEENPNLFKFICEDNLKAPKLQEIPKQFDVITFKRPYIDKYNLDAFQTMIKQSYEALRKDGVIINTFLTHTDMSNYEKALKKLNIEPAIVDRNYSYDMDCGSIIIRK